MAPKINLRHMTILVLAILSFNSSADPSIPNFETWCPGGMNLSHRDGVFYANNTPLKAVVSKDASISVKSGSTTFLIQRFSDGLQVSVSGKPESTGQCSIKGAQMHISPAERAGQGKFNATGLIPCAEARSQPTHSCPFGVARDPGGNASVRIELANKKYRFINFENGKPMGADLTQADGDMSFSSKKDGDLYFIRSGKERYEIPEAIIYGG